MNAKKAKRIRQGLRRAGIAPGHAELTAPNKCLVPVHTGRLDAMGKPIFHQALLMGTMVLAKDCGRAVYKAAKRAARAA